MSLYTNGGLATTSWQLVYDPATDGPAGLAELQNVGTTNALYVWINGLHGALVAGVPPTAPAGAIIPACAAATAPNRDYYGQTNSALGAIYVCTASSTTTFNFAITYR